MISHVTGQMLLQLLLGDLDHYHTQLIHFNKVVNKQEPLLEKLTELAGPSKLQYLVPKSCYADKKRPCSTKKHQITTKNHSLNFVQRTQVFKFNNMYTT